jgi:succinate dehydrogenase/fumarate reductase flavoprotein subunit
MRVLQELPAQAAYDLVVVGAGGAGLSAALFAAIGGARVLLVERTSHVGGTTAWSAGTTWVPGTHHAAAVHPGDTLADAALYLDQAVGTRSPAALRQAFLAHGAQAVQHMEKHSEVRYRPYPRHPDYISDLPGSTLAGRALEPLPFDGRRLGPLLDLVRPPIPEFTVLGGMMVDRTDIHHLLGMTRSWASLRHAVRIVGRHAIDRLTHTRGTRLVMGNALVGRLLYSLSQHASVDLALNTEVQSLESTGGRTTGLTLCHQDRFCRVSTALGLVMASGGFNRHAQRRNRLLPGVPQAWCPAAPGHTGALHDLVEQAGGCYGGGGLSHAFWAPVSLRARADGSTAVFPHFVMDRAKPGVLALDRRGQRFVNESTSYHLFGLAMQQPGPEGSTPAVPAWLVCDDRALHQYGLGLVRPGGHGLAALMADGYLLRGDSLAELAGQMEMAPEQLQHTVQHFNAMAAQGLDSDFGRGTTAYQQNLGDPTWPGPNPNMGALQQGPFWAVRLYPGDIGAATGFATDAHARVLDEAGQPLNGLYAVGNDMQSIMGGVYPAPGITLGPGLVFAHLAVCHALGHRSDRPCA